MNDVALTKGAIAAHESLIDINHTRTAHIQSDSIRVLSTQLDHLIVEVHALGAIPDADVVVFMVQGGTVPDEQDEKIAQAVRKFRGPKILVINKIDVIPQDVANARYAAYEKMGEWDRVLLISALEGHGVEGVLDAILELLPKGPLYFPAGQVTDQTERTLAAEIIREAVLELSYTAHDLAPFARDLGHVDAAGDVRSPFAWDEDRRLVLRAKLDALYFILYGVFDPADSAQSRDDICYIYSTFPIVEREETEKWGTYRSRDLCLAWINALMAGRPEANVVG